MLAAEVPILLQVWQRHGASFKCRWLAQAKGKPVELTGFKPDIPAHVPVEEHERILSSLQHLGAIWHYFLPVATIWERGTHRRENKECRSPTEASSFCQNTFLLTFTNCISWIRGSYWSSAAWLLLNGSTKSLWQFLSQQHALHPPTQWLWADRVSLLLVNRQ